MTKELKDMIIELDRASTLQSEEYGQDDFIVRTIEKTIKLIKRLEVSNDMEEEKPKVII